MKKERIIWLTLLMGLSVLGIIGVQFFWIREALEIRRARFDQNVREGLQQVVARMEQEEDLKVISRVMPAGDLRKPRKESLNDSQVIVFGNGKKNQIHALPEVSMKIHSSDPNTQEMDSFSFSMHVPDSKMFDEFGKEMAREAQQLNNHIYKSLSQMGRGVSTPGFLDSLSMEKIEALMELGKIPSEIPPLGSFDLDTLISIPEKVRDSLVVEDTGKGANLHIYAKGMQFPDSFFKAEWDSLLINMESINQRLEKRTEHFSKTIHQFITEVSLKRSPPDPEYVKELVSEEFSDRGLSNDFSLSIHSESLSPPEEEAEESSNKTYSYQVRLYPNDVIPRHQILSISYPNGDTLIFKSMGRLLVMSLFFSLFIIIAFGLSVFFMVRQKRLSEMKNDFINNMTHEFKTPIATIGVAADSINNDRVISNANQVRYFTSLIKKENKRMNKQVEKILQMARLERRDVLLQFEHLDVNQLVEEAVEGIRLQVESRGGQISFHPNTDKSEIEADWHHALQVVCNLLDNANKYSPDTPTIEVQTFSDRKGVWIRVKDQGEGMARKVQKHIFESFYRKPSGNVHNIKGHGLGLSYVKEIMEAHHGRVTVESEVGVGSCFTIFFPFLQNKNGTEEK